MADAILEWTDDLDVLLGAAEHDFGKVPPGSPPTLVEHRLWNNLAAGPAVDDGRNLRLIVQARESGDTAWQVDGIGILEARGFRVRQIAENSVAVSRAFFNLGTGITLPLADLEDGKYHAFEVQPLAPAGSDQIISQWHLAVADDIAVSVGDPAITGRGICRGIGAGLVTGVVDRSGSIGTTGIDQLDVPDYSYVHLGIPHSELLQALTIDANDGAPAALAAGESYLYYLVMGAAGLAIVKGLKTTGPVFPDDAPTLGADEAALGWGERHFSNNLTFFELSGAERDFLYSRVSGLNATVGNTAGPALVDGMRIDYTTESVVPLTDDALNSLWLLRDGTFAVTTDGSTPQPGALLFFEHTMVAGVETLRSDRRRWVGRSRTADFLFDAAAHGDTVAFYNSSTSTFWVRPDMVAGWMDPLPPAWAVAPTAGQIAFDLLVDATSSHPSSGSDDRRVLWAWNATAPVAVGLPETAGLAWPPGSVLSVQAVSTMVGGTFTGQVAVSVVLDEG